MYERKKRPPQRKAEPAPEPTPPRYEEEEEKRLCGLAMDLAGQWLKEGTAPAQVVCHFLKLASIREKVELEKLRNETKLAQAKCDSLNEAKEQKQKYEEVIAAMKSYNGQDSEWETIPDEYPYDMDYSP